VVSFTGETGPGVNSIGTPADLRAALEAVERNLLSLPEAEPLACRSVAQGAIGKQTVAAEA
jgi:hypothetical protein